MRRHSYHERNGDEVTMLRDGRFYRPNGDQVAPTEVSQHPRGMFCATRPQTPHEALAMDAAREGSLDRPPSFSRVKSPNFPTIAEAADRRRKWWQAFIARWAFALAAFCTLLAIFTDTPAKYSGGGVFVGLAIFVLTCFVAARKNRT